MKKFAQFLEVILISIALFLLIPEISTWISSGHFNITMHELRESVVLGILIPIIIYFSRKIRNEAAFVLFIVLIIVLTISIVPHLQW